MTSIQVTPVSSGLERALSLPQARQYLALIDLEVEQPTVEYLAKICRNTLAFIPFQNFTMLLRTRVPPTWEQIVEDMLSGLGGLCTTFNPFLCALLHQLGFTPVLLPSSMQGEADMHMAVGVLLSERFYWLDCGNGFPYLQPLDTALPGRWKFAGFSYTGRRNDHILEIEQSVLGTQLKCLNQRVSLTPVHYSHFDLMRQRHCLDAGYGPFLTGLRLNRWLADVGFVLRDDLVADVPQRFSRMQRPEAEAWIRENFADIRILKLYREADDFLREER